MSYVTNFDRDGVMEVVVGLGVVGGRIYVETRPVTPLRPP